jgi:plastocyanin
MTLRRISIPLAIAGLLFAAPAFARSNAHTLVGQVGPGFKIEVTTTADKDVKTLKAGTYTFRIEDKSSIHDFHLKGPGVNKATAVSFTGKQTWTVKLKPGTYTYQCDPHASFGMKGTFRVTS